MYVNTNTLEMISRRQLVLANPDKSLPQAPADIPSLNVAYLHDDYRPEVPFGHIAVSGGPEFVDGKWRVSYTVVARPVAAVAADIKGSVTEMRWAKETGGITINGMQVGTSIDDQNRITSVVANARRAGVETVKFKAHSGWIELTVDAIEAVAAAIALHVQGCFSTEFDHHQAIDALTTLEALGAYDIQAGWPEASVA